MWSTLLTETCVLCLHVCLGAPMVRSPADVSLALSGSSLLVVILASLLQMGQLRRGQGVKPHLSLQGVQLHIPPVLLSFQAQELKQVSLQNDMQDFRQFRSLNCQSPL